MSACSTTTKFEEIALGVRFTPTSHRWFTCRCEWVKTGRLTADCVTLSDNCAQSYSILHDYFRPDKDFGPSLEADICELPVEVDYLAQALAVET